MNINFYKYQGAGNDFVIIDNRASLFEGSENPTLIARLCNRRFGIGADGLILLNRHPEWDFEMHYFNADGHLGSMCGNGGRCIVAFAFHLGAIGDKCSFMAIDGLHHARVVRPNWIELQMVNVDEIESQKDYLFMDTGSPHYVEFVENLSTIDVFQQGRAIRYNDRFQSEGTNVNFVQVAENGIKVATYERGVEDETLACGTGVTAAAIAYYLKEKPSETTIPITTKGGQLEVRFNSNAPGQFSNIWLCGPADLVFKGNIETSINSPE